MNAEAKITKARSKRQRRKRGKISLPGGAQIDQTPTGRDRRHTNQPQEDARLVALNARQRITGKDAKAATDTVCGTDLGLCIDALTKGEERAQLLDAWDAISAARRNYLTRTIGTTGSPQGAAIAMIPDRMETDQNLRVDIRTAEERDKAAARAWAAWEAKIATLPTPQHRWAIKGALGESLGEYVLWRNRAVTAKGRLAVDALRIVSTTA